MHAPVRMPPRVRLRSRAAAGLSALFVLAFASISGAVNTRSFVLDSSSELSAGVLDRVSVTSDGQVVLGDGIERIAPDPAAHSIWSLLDVGDGSVLAGSGIDGRIYRVVAGRPTVYAETGALVVSSLARAEDGTVYAGTLPEGKIYRVLAPRGSSLVAPELLVELPGATYVWSLVWDRQRHTLLAATGPDGKLFSIDRTGHATVIFDADETHLYSMALAADGTVYAGAGGGHAIVYAVAPNGQSRAVTRLVGDEVRALALGPNGILYAAANEFAEPPEPPRRLTSTAARMPVPGGPVAPRPRPGRGAVYRISSNGALERVYASPDAHVTALEGETNGTVVYAAIGVGGRIIALNGDRTYRVAFDVDETQVLALALTTRAHMFATADSGAFYVVSSPRPADATWTSRVLDAGAPSRWGVVQPRGVGTLEWQARSGNAEPPDSTWSPWTALDGDRAVQAPGARFVQVRARWSRNPASVLRSVTVYYLPVNQRAILTEVAAEPRSGDARPPGLRITWRVDNPDADTLRYRIRFRAEGESTWRSVLRTGEYVAGTSYDWTVDALPEGYYRIQVEVADDGANPDAEVLRDQRASEPVLLDNTPPTVSAIVVGNTLRGEARDGTSAITRIEMAVDSLEWRPVRAVDGILDEPSERFDVALPPVADSGDHVLSVRAYDDAGNIGTSSARFHAPAAPTRVPPERGR